MDDCNETTRLLNPNPNAAPETRNLQNIERTKSTSALYIILSISLIILIINIGSNIAAAPQTAILEGIICDKYYGSIRPDSSADHFNGQRCKIEPVQSELAIINGWRDTFETIPGILFAIPYGTLADCIGRRKVLLLAILGCLLGDCWTRLICWYPNIFPLRLVWISGAWQFIGGGAATMNSMFFVMVADVCPPARRQINAAVLVSELLSVPAGAALISVNPWIPYMGSSFIMIFGISLAIFLIPETFPSTKERQSHNQSNEAASIFSQDARANPKSFLGYVCGELVKMNEACHWMKRNVSVVLILSSFFVSQLGRQAVELVLQYSSKKFHWTFAKASYLISLRAAVNLLVLAALIPALSNIFTTQLKIDGVMKDKRLTQISGALLVAGSVAIFLAASPILLIIGQILFALGFAFGITARSLVTSLVEQKHLGAVYTGIAVTSYAGVLVGGPLLANSFRWGMRLGNSWTGLPFLVAAGLFLLALTAVSLARLPPRERPGVCSEPDGQHEDSRASV